MKFILAFLLALLFFVEECQSVACPKDKAKLCVARCKKAGMEYVLCRANIFGGNVTCSCDKKDIDL